MSEAKRTPLYDFHAAHGARFVEFGGWLMPVSYSGIIEEHKAVREQMGLFDVSHMGEFHVNGAGAESFLDYLVTNKIAGMAVGKAVYSPMCYPDGGVVDDLIVYRTGETAFLVCVNAANIEKDFAWFVEQSASFDCSVEDRSEAYGLLALQGPLVAAFLEDLVEGGVGDIKRFWHKAVDLADKSVRLSRTGYTGEDGFEIYCLAEDAAAIAEALWKAGEAKGLKLCGLGARDSLRLEAGYPLYGHEISQSINPLRGGIAWTVKLAKEDFIGKAALAEEKAAGVPQSMIHFYLDDRRIARDGTSVLCDGQVVGQVVSGTQSPILQKPIGAALVDTAVLGKPLCVDLRGKQIALNVKQPPLHMS